MNIVVLDGAAANPGDLSWDNISLLGELTVFDSSDSSEVITRSLDADIVIVNKVKMSKAILDELPNLKCICLLATGYNNIDLDACRIANIAVCNAVGYASASVAQHVFAMILSIYNQVNETNTGVHLGEWTSSHKWTYWHSPISELSGQTLGIYGLGKIGMAVAKVGLGFGMKVIAHKRNLINPKAEIELCDFNSLLRRSDILTLHAPLSKDNEFVINSSSLSKMKPGAILINTGRGGLVNELDLKYALLNGGIKAAGLDVLSEEPPGKDHVLMGVKNCIITPHQAWAAKESRQRLLDIVAKNIEAFSKGNPINVVSS